MNQRLERRNQRIIQKRIIIRGVLELDTPTCLSSGDTEANTDLPLLRDMVGNKALLLGSSIAGALRSYLESHNPNAQLFGGTRLTADGEQSPLIVEDALSQQMIATELRDGVKINDQTGTASDQAKYDLELLQAGTRFDLGFELLVDPQTEALLKQELAIALSGLEQGHIPLGMKKRRGFGQCSVKQWQVWKFNLTDENKRQEWLLFEHQRRSLHQNVCIHAHIADALKITAPDRQPSQETCVIEATFTLASPLLIRSGQQDQSKAPDGQQDQSKAPDVVHLKSNRSGGSQPVISGTSLAGVLRHRAVKIIKTLNLDESIAQEIFGYDSEYVKKQPTSKQGKAKGKASRLTVQESVIENTQDQDLVQTRIAIDRFTGGALDGALFPEQPVCPSANTQVQLKWQLKQAEDPDVGLLLLLLKDLWTGDLAIGGGSSIGRGRLQGQSATISYQGKSYEIRQEQPDQPLIITDPDALEGFVQAFASSTPLEVSA